MDKENPEWTPKGCLYNIYKSNSIFKLESEANATFGLTALAATLKPFKNSSLLIVNLMINSFLLYLLYK